MSPRRASSAETIVTLSAGVRMPAGSGGRRSGSGGNRDAATSSTPMVRSRLAKKSGDMVTTRENSPRSRMSASTSGSPSIHGEAWKVSATSSAVSFPHRVAIAAAKPRVSMPPTEKASSRPVSSSRQSSRRAISSAAEVPRSSVPSMSKT
ncbi:MAG TPA: hypothetical protein VFO68_22710 [Actinophytocola sp.]|nr:hypothetical protein [Actinophytocola sp.]HET9142197.1 hypothetical protein [Actinophytocola sp.]